MTNIITGSTLIEWGFKPGKWFKEGIGEATRREITAWRQVSSYASEADARKGYACRVDRCPWGNQIRLIDPAGH